MSKDLIGKTFSSLTVLSISEERRYNALNYNCLCECGNNCLATKGQLTSSKKKSCGCKQNIKPKQGTKHKVLVGEVFGRMTVISGVVCNKDGHYSVDCLCTCGEVKKTRIRDLLKGRVVSCGCKRLEGEYTHNMCNSRPYSIYGHMKRRCNTPKEAGYPHYGGRGITYDAKWETFEGFWEDMEDGYSDDLELDRIDSDKNYCKDNCRWADSGLQAFNTRKRKDNSSGVTGVSWNKNEKVWETYISKNNELIRLGKYDDLELATFVRKEAELKYYGFYKHKEEVK